MNNYVEQNPSSELKLETAGITEDTIPCEGRDRGGERQRDFMSDIIESDATDHWAAKGKISIFEKTFNN